MEQAYLEDINRMRVDPQGELSVLFSATNPALQARDASVQAAINFFQVDGFLLLSQWAQLQPVAPVAWNEQLTEAALGHNEVMKAADLQSHQIGDEPALGERVRATGYNLRRATENIYAFAESHIHGHAGFVIDWGDGPGGIQDPAGHRDNYMDPNVDEVGISVITDNNPNTDVGPYLVTQDFGRRGGYKPQLLGVVYEDGNRNGIYDPGEGYGNMEITVSGTGGTFTTTTMSAGGYQLEIPPGTYQVTASGFPIAASLAVGDVQMVNRNVKVDFELTTSPRAPFAADDLASTTEDMSVAIPVINNDFSPVGNILANSVQITRLPEFGSASVNASGNIVYTPSPNYSGGDTLEYTVRDSTNLVSNAATVSITVGSVSDPPVAQDRQATVAEGDAVVISLEDAVSDPENDINWNTLRVVTAPGHGIASVNNSARTIRFTATGNYFGPDQFEYQVADQTGQLSNRGKVTIEITNVPDRPIAVADQFAVVGTNAVLLPVLGNDQNPDGSLDDVTIEITTDPARGSATLVDSKVRYTPSPTAQPGSDSFTYRLSSNGGTSAAVTVSLFLVSADRPWHNPVNAYDVNGDGAVSPLDALSVINHIGDTLTYPSNLEGLELGPPPFVDVDADGNSSPLDALLVINQLTGGAAASSASSASAVTGDATGNETDPDKVPGVAVVPLRTSPCNDRKNIRRP